MKQKQNNKAHTQKDESLFSRSLLETKRAQVTIFVVAGAVLLLASTLFLILNSSLSEEKPDVDIPDVSLEARPAVELVTSCMEQIAKEGLRDIGASGGMLNPPKVKYPSYKGEGVEFPPDVVPFWRHLTNENCNNPSGCEVIARPPLCRSGECYGMPTGDESIQEQLERYVDDNLESCVNQFISLSDVYDVENTQEPETEIFFSDGATNVQLSYPIKITSKSTGNTVEFDNYLVSLEVDMLGMYDMASSILSFEDATNYYERQTMNLITIYSGLDGVLPPTDEISFFAGFHGPWVQAEVKDTLEQDLLPMMSFVRFVNAMNVDLIQEDENLGDYTQYSNGVYASFIPKMNEEVYPFDVTHVYTYDPIFAQVDEGQPILKVKTITAGDDMVSKLSGLAINDYRFHYHLSYPLIVKITDPFAFNGEGYDFQFALEINVRNNVPGYDNFTYVGVPVSTSEIGLADFEQRLEQEITIYAKDKHTGEPLEDVIISYVCGNEFDIGSTRITPAGSASLTSTFPYCEYGGFIRYRKLGYLGEAFEYNNREGGEDQTFTVELWPVEKKPVRILKRTNADLEEIENAGAGALELYATAASDIGENQSALVSVMRFATSAYDTDVPMVGFVKAEGPNMDREQEYAFEQQDIMQAYISGVINASTKDMMLALLEESYELDKQTVESLPTTIELVPGTYNLDATLLDFSGIQIPETDYEDVQADMEGKSKSVFDFSLEDIVMNIFVSEDVVLPAQNFTTWPRGGSLVNFTVTEAEVYGDSTIVFYVLEQDLPASWVDLMNLEPLEEYQQGKEYYIMPYFEPNN